MVGEVGRTEGGVEVESSDAERLVNAWINGALANASIKVSGMIICSRIWVAEMERVVSLLES